MQNRKPPGGLEQEINRAPLKFARGRMLGWGRVLSSDLRDINRSGKTHLGGDRGI